MIVHELPIDVTQEILNQYEIFYWKQYKDCGFKVMNVREPGSKGKHNSETKLKMSKPRLTKINRKGKHIIQYDLKGNFIKEWPSASTAEKTLNTNILSSNISACANGKQKTSYGYIWKYKEN